MARPMRRADRALTHEQATAILNKSAYGVLSTVSPDGQPYGVPVSYAYAHETLYFHCAVEGHKLDNLAANPRVSFCVVGETLLLSDQFGTLYESAIVFGNAVEMAGEAKHAALVELLKKYSPEYIEQGECYIENVFEKTRVFKIEVDTLSGKARR